MNHYKLSEPFNYASDSQYGLNDQFSFWNDVAKKYAYWDKEYDSTYSSGGSANIINGEWFKGGLLNTCYNALDKHIKNGRGNEIAFVHEIPLEQLTHQITYQQLYDKVCRLSRSLKNLGVGKGDMVLIYMHNSIELVISTLACSRIGAIHNVLFGCFLRDNLIDTINRCKPAAIIVSNYGYIFGEVLHFYDSILDAYSSVSVSASASVFKPKHTILYQRNDFKNSSTSCGNNEGANVNNQDDGYSLLSNGIDQVLDWDELVCDKVEPLIEYELVEPNHPVYVIFSSGTTNKPKAIQRETAGNIIGASYLFNNIYGLNQGDTYFNKASMGWISGHTTVIYGCLFVGVKSVFLEGSFNSSGGSNDMWSLIEKYKVNVFSTTPITVKLLIKEDPNGEIASKYNQSTLRKIVVSADKSHQSLIEYLNQIVKRRIVCNEYGLSESGGVIVGNPSNQLTITNDSIGKPNPGYDLKIVSKSKENPSLCIENKANEIGEIAFKLPVFPFISLSQFGDDQNQTLFKEYYLNEYDGYLRTKDMGYFDENGLWYYHSRSDDSISVGGYTLSTVIIENEVLKHSYINDCCVIGIDDALLTQFPIGLLILKNGISINNNDQLLNLKNQINTIITNSLTFGANLNDILIVKDLPKTKTGKKIKSLITSIFNDKPYSIPSSIQDINMVEQLLIEYLKYKNNK